MQNRNVLHFFNDFYFFSNLTLFNSLSLLRPQVFADLIIQLFDYVPHIQRGLIHARVAGVGPNLKKKNLSLNCLWFVRSCMTKLSCGVECNQDSCSQYEERDSLETDDVNDFLTNCPSGYLHNYYLILNVPYCC